ncbi:chaplin family protein [Streptomyces avermitilis]|uniref:chaplin family protein n=1 Tax=Streptomyces avermitilis TaxID=33903 RepID=UPI0033FBC97A
MRQVTRKGLMTVAAATGVLAATGGYAHADSGAYGPASHSPGVLSGNSVQVPVHVPVNVCGNTVNVVGLFNPALGNQCANGGGGGHQGGGGHHGGGGYGDSPSGGGGGHQGGGDHQGGGYGGGPSGGGGGSQAGGHTGDSPGVGSGNQVQVPVDVPVNVCGNNVTVGGLGNAAGGDACANTPGGGHAATPPGGGGGTTPPGGGGGGTTPPGGGGGGTTPPGGGGGTTPPGGGGGTTPPGTPEHPGKPGQPGGDDSAHPNHPGGQSVTQPEGTAQLAHTGSDMPLGLLVPAGAGALLGGVLLYRRARSAA